jgi:TolA-binding protein
MKQHKHVKKLITGLGILCILAEAQAQQTQIHIEDGKDYRRGVELYESGHYLASQKFFTGFLKRDLQKHDLLLENASFYRAMSAVKLRHTDGAFLAETFIAAYPNSVHFEDICLAAGDYFYESKKYAKAIYWYEKINPAKLHETSIQSEYYFKKAYSYFEENRYDEASDVLIKIIDKESSVQQKARYYYAYIAYYKGNYNRALPFFEELKKDSEYRDNVSFYITQIYFNQQRYRDVIAFASAIVGTNTNEQNAELARLVGESHAKIGNYDMAIEFLEQYRDTGKKLPDEGMYQLGYAYYKTDRNREALNILNKIVDAEPSLAQNAYYHLAGAYLKTADKQSALNAFQKAADIALDPKITEHSSFNFAKLSYELDNPYFDATISLQHFITTYPDSEYLDEAYTYLVNTFLHSKNYTRAIKSLEENGMGSHKLRMAYQEISYFRAVQLFNDGDYTQALDYLDKSLKYPINNTFHAQALFWKAEAHYRLKHYRSAAENYRAFQAVPGALALKDFKVSDYNLAYAYYNQKSYQKAIDHFKRYTLSAREDDPRIHDAYLRIGDSNFASQAYKTATSYYEKAIAGGSSDSDYAAFQKALCLGLQGKDWPRADALSAFVEQYPESNYLDDAMYELGNSYLGLKRYDKALTAYHAVIDQFPSSSYVPDAHLKIGLVHYNSDNDDKAIEEFRAIVDKYPATQVAKEAIANAKNIYVDNGNVDAYIGWIEELNFMKVNRSALDSTSYEAAELQYLKGNLDKAVESFNAYLQRYNDGYFVLNAHFYKAECLYKNKVLEDALESYRFVIDHTRSDFTEKSVKNTADIYYNTKRYVDARNYYHMLDSIAEFAVHQLDARRGLMNTNYQLEEYKIAITEAEEMLKIKRLSTEDKQIANSIIARSAYERRQYRKALKGFAWLDKNTEGSKKAEAKYYQALILHHQGAYEDSQRKVFELAKELPDYKKWLAKAMIVLARDYWALGDEFQASHTLQQLLENFDDPQILAEARNFKMEIEAAKAAEKKKEEQKEEAKPTKDDEKQGEGR